MHLTDKAFKQGVATLLTVFPHLTPDAENREFVMKFWKRAFEQVAQSEQQFIDAVNSFVLNTTKLYPSDNWLAMLLNNMKPKIKETAGDVVELIFDVLRSVSFSYPNIKTVEKMEWLKSKSPIAYAVGNRLGWKQMAVSENYDVLRGQIRTLAEAEIARANQNGYIASTAEDVVEDKNLIPLISSISDKKLLD